MTLCAGKAITKVINATTYAPIEGQQYQLECDVITEGNPQITEYEWEGETATGETLTITNLDRQQHSKTFRCAAHNSPLDGEFGEGLPVQVWCE